MKIQNNFKHDIEAPDKSLNQMKFLQVQNCMGGMQPFKEDLIFVQNEAKQLCTLSVEDGEIKDIVFDVDDFKPKVEHQTEDALAKLGKVFQGGINKQVKSKKPR